MAFSDILTVRIPYITQMTSKIVKATSKGQITIPSEWRRLFPTENFSLQIDHRQIIIRPVVVEDISDEEVIFDADRDNQGKGIKVKEMIKMLKTQTKN